MGVSNLPFHGVCVLSRSFLVRMAVFLSFFQSHGLLTCRESSHAERELSRGSLLSPKECVLMLVSH